jgi:hypothetical protein
MVDSAITVTVNCVQPEIPRRDRWGLGISLQSDSEEFHGFQVLGSGPGDQMTFKHYMTRTETVLPIQCPAPAAAAAAPAAAAAAGPGPGPQAARSSRS